MDEIVFKDYRTLTYFFYINGIPILFSHTKGEGPDDVARLRISKAGVSSDYTRRQWMSRDYLFMSVDFFPLTGV